MKISDLNTKPVHYHPTYNVEKKTIVRSSVGDGPISLYIHIPFCMSRCHFCTFAIVTGSSVKEELVVNYLAALKKEMAFHAATLEKKNVKIKTIQIGGGTPTLLSAEQLEDLLHFIYSSFDCSNLTEVIIEGFPSSITKEKVEILSRIELLKLNIGIQTFNDKSRDMSGRRHSLNEAISAIELAKQAGIYSVGADIIFGLPFSTEDTVANDLNIIADLEIDHLALYPLWIYSDTVIGRKFQIGKLPPPDYQNFKAQYLTSITLLEKRGYEHYTAFHYTTSEKHKHQYGLWQMYSQEWLGFGMAAMSYLNGQVYLNEENIVNYIDSINSADVTKVEGKILSPLEDMKFSLLFGLRLKNYPLAHFKEKFDRNALDVFEKEIQALNKYNLISYNDEYITLTPDGVLALGSIEEYFNQS